MSKKHRIGEFHSDIGTRIGKLKQTETEIGKLPSLTSPEVEACQKIMYQTTEERESCQKQADKLREQAKKLKERADKIEERCNEREVAAGWKIAKCMKKAQKE